MCVFWLCLVRVGVRVCMRPGMLLSSVVGDPFLRPAGSIPPKIAGGGVRHAAAMYQ